MNAGTLTRIVAVGALTGMRSMAGLATLAAATPGITRAIVTLAAAGEMIADKTAVVGDRIDAAPLAGRAVIGAAAGAWVAREQHQNMLAGGLIGGAAAVLAAHLAYHGRKRLPLSGVAGGLLEDTLVVALASRYASLQEGRSGGGGRGYVDRFSR
jgi:uncharacterized protein YfiM (DUF2279 family)